MKANSLLLVTVIALISCSSPHVEEVIDLSVERSVIEAADLSDGMARADLSIKGMSCEIMCGGAIKKALANVDGVEGTEIKFDADEELDHAIVTYDGNVVTDAALISAVSAIHDGAYQVEKVQVEVATGSIGRSSGSNGEGASSKTSFTDELPAIQMPNLMDILSRIIRI
jgi:copper chaperone CopZ